VGFRHQGRVLTRRIEVGEPLGRAFVDAHTTEEEWLGVQGLPRQIPAFEVSGALYALFYRRISDFGGAPIACNQSFILNSFRQSQIKHFVPWYLNIRQGFDEQDPRQVETLLAKVRIFVSRIREYSSLFVDICSDPRRLPSFQEIRGCVADPSDRHTSSQESGDR
jgi:hypothetical protein